MEHRHRNKLDNCQQPFLKCKEVFAVWGSNTHRMHTTANFERINPGYRSTALSSHGVKIGILYKVVLNDF